MTIFSKTFIFTLIFSFSFYITYNQVFNDFPSDIMAHIWHAKTFAPEHELKITYPLWHLLVYGISEFLNIKISQSAVIVTAFITVSLAITIFIIIKSSLKYKLAYLSENQKEYLYLSMTTILMIASAIYVPFFNQNIYIGQASCSVWHNVTLLIVKPLAFFSLYMLIKYFETKQMKWLLSSSFVILLSIYAKPSFIIVFLPASFIFLIFFIIRQMKLSCLQIFSNIVNIFKQFKREILFLIILSSLSTLILWGQYISVFTGESTSKVTFDIFGVWSLYTSNIFISILLSYLFPITVLFLIDEKTSNLYLFSWILSIISVLFFAFLAEAGPKYAHGNFGWSQQISVHILFTMSLIEYVKNYTRLHDWKKYILSIILSLHVISGIFYLLKLSKGLYYG